MEILSEKLWLRLEEISEESTFCRAAIAYLSCDEHIKFRKGDLLIVNASYNAISNGVTSALILERLFNEGVELYSNDTLHTKILFFNEYVYMGSANLSKNSKNNLIEAGVIFSYKNNAQVFEEVQKILRSIQNDERTKKITREEINELKKISVQRQEIINRNKFKQENNEKRYWAIGIYQKEYDGDEQRIEEELQLLVKENEEIDFFFFKESHAKLMFRECKENDIVAMFTRNKAKDPIDKVYLVSIVHIFMDENRNKICFYRILKEISVEGNETIFNNELVALYKVKWVGRELKNQEIQNTRKFFLNTF